MMPRSGVTLYQTLGVEIDASVDTIKTSFRQLALKYHPDRFEGAKRQEAEERFQAITEAFNVLSRAESREKYDRELAQGVSRSGGMDPKEIARRLAAKGAQAYKNKEFAEAMDLLRSALDHDDTLARAHYFMGATLQRLPGRTKDALRHVERAAQLEPQNATIKADAAALCLEVGLNSRAERYASEALGIDPTNSKAAEVIYNLRNPDQGDTDAGSGGIFGRLRKKS